MSSQQGRYNEEARQERERVAAEQRRQEDIRVEAENKRQAEAAATRKAEEQSQAAGRGGYGGGNSGGYNSSSGYSSRTYTPPSTSRTPASDNSYIDRTNKTMDNIMKSFNNNERKRY